MNITAINSASLTVPPVQRADRVLSNAAIQANKPEQTKVSENQSLNSSKTSSVVNINQEYYSTAPIFDTKNSLKTLFESVQREIPGESAPGKIENENVDEINKQGNPPEIKRKEVGKGFFITLPGEKKTDDKSNLPRLDSHKNGVFPYFANQRLDTGNLLDMML